MTLSGRLNRVEPTGCEDAEPAALPESYVIACLVQGEWERALAVIEELGPSPAYAPHLASAAGRLLAERQHAEAVRVAAKATALDESCSAAQSVLGQSLVSTMGEGSDARAETALRRAIELDPLEQAARVTLASLYLRQDRLTEARTPIEEALALDPADAAAREALKRLRKAAKSASGSGRSAAGRGTLPAPRNSEPRSTALDADDLRRLAARAHQRVAEAGSLILDQPAVSLCLITRDEARNLPRVIESVRGLATEIIVVDTGSTDETVRVAQRLGAKVQSIPWEDDFAAARNHSLRTATGDWLLVLDADDELVGESLPAMRSWLGRHPEAEVVGLYRRYPHPEMQRDSVSVQSRLFRNRCGLHYRGAVHEQLYTSDGRLAQPDVTLTATIYHHGALEGRDPTGRRRERNRRILERNLEHEPGNARARFYLGLTFFEGEGWKEAVPHLQAALQAADEGCDFREKAYACLGNALLNAHRPLDAEVTLREGLARFPDHPELWFCLGLVLDALGRLGEAVEAHEAALRGRFGPSLNWHDWACREAKPHLALCDLRLTLGDESAAAEHLLAAEQFTGTQPCHAQIREAIEQTQVERARRAEEQARCLTESEAAFRAGDASAGLCFVTALLEAKQVDRARDVAEQWMPPSCVIPEARVARGRVLLADGKAKEALQEFAPAHEACPACVEAWRGEAAAWRALNETEREEQALRGAVNAASDAKSMECLGEFYLRREQWADAIGWLQRSLEQEDGAWSAWLALGQATLGAGNLPGAMPCFQRAATLSGGNVAVRVALGKARAHLASLAQAKESEAVHEAPLAITVRR